MNIASVTVTRTFNTQCDNRAPLYGKNQIKQGLTGEQYDGGLLTGV